MVFVALLLIMLFGMVAFAIDTGALYQERRELQNGADAAVLAIAEDCATGATACDTATVTATAEAYADGNAGDDRAEIHELILDTTAQSIEVATETETSDGGTIFRPFFAQVIGFTGTEVGARAKAIWGTVGSASDIPLTVSWCEMQKLWGELTVDEWKAALPEPPPPEGSENYQLWAAAYGGNGPAVDGFTFLFHDGNTTEECNGPAGQDLPGGFGWLEQAEIGCTAETSGDDGWWYDVDPGADAPSPECPADTVETFLGKILFVPVFDDFQGPPEYNDKRYQMNGYVALYLTGYKFSGSPAWTQSIAGQGDPCSGSTRCIQGYPTKATCWGCEPILGGGGTNYGVVAIALTE